MKREFNKFWIIVLISILVLGVILFYITRTSEKVEIDLEKCESIEYNGENNINVVFMSEKKAAENYIESLFKFEPFGQNRNKFNFYLIKDYQPECELYKGIALYCYSKDLVKKSGSCPNDYVVVVKELAKGVRSSAYMNVVSINSKHDDNVFAHEFGHVFANFAEEYTPAKIPKKSKNCVKSCNKFEGKENECKGGCSKDSYFRSIDQGVMRTLKTNEFGSYNEYFIQKRIDESTKESSKITGNVVMDEEKCSKESYLLVEASLSDGKLNLGKSEEVAGCLGEGYGSYTQEIGSEKTSFNPQYVFTDFHDEESGELSGETYENDKSFYISLPKIKDDEEVVIKNEDDEVVSVMKKSVYWCLNPSIS